MSKRLAALTAVLVLLTPVMLGSSHIEGEDYLPFLFVVFAITWLAFFAYAFFITRKQADLKREIETLRQSIEESEGT